MSDISTGEIIHLNVGGQRFSTSKHTLTSVPDSFFTALLSGRVPTIRDETGALFIDRDPEIFKIILNYLRTKKVDIGNVELSMLKHEAQYYSLTPLVRRILLCENLESSTCGTVYFHGLIQAPPAKCTSPFKVKKSIDELSAIPETKSCEQGPSSSNHISRSHSRKASDETDILHPLSHMEFTDSMDIWTERFQNRVRFVRAHYNMLVIVFSTTAVIYRMKESTGWQRVYATIKVDSPITHVALNTKFGPQGTDRMLAVAMNNGVRIQLWSIGDDGGTTDRGIFTLRVNIDNLFFVGNQMVALSKQGVVGIWQSMNQNWQIQKLVPISCYDTAGSSLLLGCTNGSVYYIDMQKFPLRMKDNDLLITELYRDPSSDCITAISVYLTPKTNVCGNWIEIAYGTSSGAVRLIVQHPETVGHGPQLFQTYTVHNSAIVSVALTTNTVISVCSEYNHVRTWAVTRFRGMISTQPGNQSMASFKVVTLGFKEDPSDCDIGPWGDKESEQVFVQRVIPDSNQVIVRWASNGERICLIKTVDGSGITSFTVHECDGSNRMGNRPRRFLFLGTTTGSVQIFDLTTAMDMSMSQRNSNSVAIPGPCQNERDTVNKPVPMVNKVPPTSSVLGGPTPHEMLQMIEECEIIIDRECPTPSTEIAR